MGYLIIGTNLGSGTARVYYDDSLGFEDSISTVHYARYLMCLAYEGNAEIRRYSDVEQGMYEVIAPTREDLTSGLTQHCEWFAESARDFDGAEEVLSVAQQIVLMSSALAMVKA